MFFRTECRFGVPGGTYPPKKYPSAPPGGLSISIVLDGREIIDRLPSGFHFQIYLERVDDQFCLKENAFRLYFHFRMKVAGEGLGSCRYLLITLNTYKNESNIEDQRRLLLVMPISVIQFRTFLSFLSVKLRGLGLRDDCSLRCFS